VAGLGFGARQAFVQTVPAPFGAVDIAVNALLADHAPTLLKLKPAGSLLRRAVHRKEPVMSSLKKQAAALNLASPLTLTPRQTQKLR
jgi:hypothetical protein